MASHGELLVRIPVRDMTGADLATLLSANTQNYNRAKRWLAQFLNRTAEAQRGLVFQARGVTLASAFGTFTMTRAQVTTGDKIFVLCPNGEVATLTCVASSADATQGQWVAGASDTACATSVAAAISGHYTTKNFMSADNSSGTVRVTGASDSRDMANIKFWKSVTNASASSLTTAPVAIGALTSGIVTPTMAPSIAITVTLGAVPTADDTLRFGNVLLTWKASASGENQVTIGGDEATSAANLVTKINAHSILGKLMVATRDTATVTLTWASADLLAYMTYCVAAGTTPGTISGQFQNTSAVPTLHSTYTAFDVP